MLEFVIISALTITGILFCLNKWGILATYSVYRKPWMPPADCYFCMSFWLSVVPMGIYCRYTQPIVYAWFKYPQGLAICLAIATLSAFICSVIIEPKEV